MSHGEVAEPIRFGTKFDEGNEDRRKDFKGSWVLPLQYLQGKEEEGVDDFRLNK